MRKTGVFVFLAVAASMTSAGAQSGVDRAYVSGHGADQGSCQLTAPCKSFAYALSVTNTGGRIFALDAADYGPLVINKSISVFGLGSEPASITAGVTGFGIEINASNNDRVQLQSIRILNGGINVSGAASVEMTNLVVRDSPEFGLIINSPTRVIVTDSLFSNNSNVGVKQVDSGSNIALRHVTVTGGGGNGGINTNGSAEIVDCVISNNQAGGLAIFEKSFTFIKGTLITANRDGLQVVGNAAADTTTVTGNGTGVFVSGSLISYNNNNFTGNSQNDIYGPHAISHRAPD